MKRLFPSLGPPGAVETFAHNSVLTCRLWFLQAPCEEARGVFSDLKRTLEPSWSL